MEPARLSWLLALLLFACPEATPPLVDTADGSDDEAAERPDFEIRYRTHHVDIAPGFTQPVCRGTLDQIDRHVDTLTDLLDIDIQTRPTFYWFNEHADGAVTQRDDSCGWCGNACICTTSSGDTIYSGIEHIFHELTHAVVLPGWGRSDILFEEGLAYGFDGDHVETPLFEIPSEFAGGTRHGGAHFSRWLLDRFGPAKLRELFEPRLDRSSTKEEVFAAVEEVYGRSFADIEAEYFATAPVIYPAPGLCDGLEHVPWQGERWELRATPDCEAPHTFGPRDEDAAMFLSVTLDLPALPPGEWLAADVVPEGLFGRITRCIDEPVYDEEEPEALLASPPVANNVLFAPRPGRYRLTMPFPPTGERVVRLCPWNGEHPVSGEPPHACLDE